MGAAVSPGLGRSRPAVRMDSRSAFVSLFSLPLEVFCERERPCEWSSVSMTRYPCAHLAMFVCCRNSAADYSSG